MGLTRFVTALAVLSLIGCSAQNHTEPTSPPAAQAKPELVAPGLTASDLKIPSRDILVTSGDINKQYDILGEVECRLSGNSVYALGDAGNGFGAGVPSGPLKELLQKVAFTKYGERVDAVINAKAAAGVNGGFWGQLGAAYGAHNAYMTAQGIAISFHSEAQKPKH